jgi:hypothetical protein
MLGSPTASVDLVADAHRFLGPASRRPTRRQDVEETIGYEALFSAEEWDATQTGDYSLLDEEVELEFGASPDGDHGSHEVVIYDPPGQYAGNDKRFEIECERCGEIGTADDRELAGLIKRLHESLAARVIEAGVGR